MKSRGELATLTHVPQGGNWNRTCAVLLKHVCGIQRLEGDLGSADKKTETEVGAVEWDVDQGQSLSVEKEFRLSADPDHADFEGGAITNRCKGSHVGGLEFGGGWRIWLREDTLG